MTAGGRAIQRVNSSEARAQWDELLDRVEQRKSRLLIERGGVPVAAVISADELERLTRLEKERARDFEVLEEISAAFLDQTPSEIQREVTKAIREVREEDQRRATRAP